jgi:hypothetical protein
MMARADYLSPERVARDRPYYTITLVLLVPHV